MRKFLLLIAIALLGVATVCADPLCTGPTAISTGSPGCTIGTLTFNNWVVVPAGVGSPSSITLVQATTTATGYNLWFNPGLTTGGDLWISFAVAGALTGIDVTIGGSDARVTEWACSAPIVDNQCPEGTQLAYIEAGGGGGSSDSASFAGVSNLTYIFKNVGAYNDRELSTLVESFETPVPEPLTFGLIGSGLLLLGLLRRRAH
jgi:hypothetical protein